MKRDLLIKTINRLLYSQEVNKKLQDLGVVLWEYDNKNFTSLLEEHCALLVSDIEKVFEWALDLIQWRLYECVDFKIYDSENNPIHDLNKIEDFVDYLLNYHEFFNIK